MIDVTGGSILWNGGQAESPTQVSSSARVFFTVNGPAAQSGQQPSGLNARSLDDGHLLWSIPERRLEPISVTDSHVILMSLSTGDTPHFSLLGADRHTGRIAWQIDDVSSIDPGPSDGQSKDLTTPRPPVPIPVAFPDGANPTPGAGKTVAPGSIGVLDPATGSAVWRVPHLTDGSETAVEAKLDPTTGRVIVVTAQRTQSTEHAPKEILCIAHQ